jgi:hypothetical protein
MECGLNGLCPLADNARDFSLLRIIQTDFGTQKPLIQLVLGAISSGVKLTTHLHLVPRSRMMELHLHSPIRLHGILLNYLIRRMTLPFTTLMHPNRVLYDSRSRDTMTATDISCIVTLSLSLSLSCFDLRPDRKTGYLHGEPSDLPRKCCDGTLEQYRFLPHNSESSRHFSADAQ